MVHARHRARRPAAGLRLLPLLGLAADLRAGRAPGVRAWVERFVAGYGLTGQVSFDFMEDADGVVRAIECNPRTHSAITLLAGRPDVAAAYLDDDADAASSRRVGAPPDVLAAPRAVAGAAPPARPRPAGCARSPAAPRPCSTATTRCRSWPCTTCTCRRCCWQNLRARAGRGSRSTSTSASSSSRRGTDVRAACT